MQLTLINPNPTRNTLKHVDQLIPARPSIFILLQPLHGYISPPHPRPLPPSPLSLFAKQKINKTKKTRNIPAHTQHATRSSHHTTPPSRQPAPSPTPIRVTYCTLLGAPADPVGSNIYHTPNPSPTPIHQLARLSCATLLPTKGPLASYSKTNVCRLVIPITNLHYFPIT